VSSEVDEIRRQMESQVIQLQRQLQEEKEKLLLQTVRAKEEEAMAAKVEESLKDIQDRLRREKREQELQEMLSKAESQIKDLETRMAAERQTWVETLRTQSTQRDSQDRELEQHFELQIKDLERRWHEEKLGWSQALRAREEELARTKMEFEKTLDAAHAANEKRLEQLESERESLRRELKDVQQVRQEERNVLAQKLETRDKEYLSLKAQQAMIVTQLRQEKEKIDQMRQLLEKMRAEKGVLIAQVDGKEKEYFVFKSQVAIFQAKSKSEQEKLLKEMLHFREQMQRERQQWEVSLKAKENEMLVLKEAARTRENELSMLLQRKDIELDARQKEVAAWLEKESALKISVSQYEQKSRTLEERIAALSQEAATVREQALQKEKELTMLLQHRENEFRLEQARLSEQVQAREKEMSEARDRERAVRIEADGYRQQVQALEEKVRTAESQRAAEREQVLLKEKELNALLQYKESEFKNSESRLLEKIQAKEREISESRERERIAQSELTTGRLQLQALEEKVREADKQRAEEREEAREREQEKLTLIGRREEELLSFKEAVQKERELLQQQIASVKDESRRLVEDKESQIAALHREQEETRAEARRLQAEIDRRDKEIGALRSEVLVKEKDAAMALQQKEFAHRQELTRLQDRLGDLEKKITDQQKDAAQLLLQREEGWKRRENEVLMESKSKSDIIAALTTEKAVLENDKERLSEEKFSLEKAKNVELFALQQKLFTEKEEVNGLLRAKEQEIAQIKAARQSFENEMRLEIEQRYHARIAELEREKDEAARGVSQEIQHLRLSLQSELAAADEQFAREREEWKKRMAGKDRELQTLREQFEELERQAALQSSALRSDAETTLLRERAQWQEEKSALSRRIEEIRSEYESIKTETGHVISYYKEVETQLKAREAELAALRDSAVESREIPVSVHEQVPAQRGRLSSSAAIAASVAGLAVDGALPRRKGFLARVWADLNEPVIEIGRRRDRLDA
jgi:hypothetical protein